MPPHMGKWMTTRVAVHAMIMTPIQRKPSAVVMLTPVKNAAWVMAEPALPPAPMKPDATPWGSKEGGEGGGRVRVRAGRRGLKRGA